MRNGGSFLPQGGPLSSDPQGRPRILPDLIYLLLNSIGRAALGVTLVKGMGEEWRSKLSDYVRVNGKFTKFEVFYSPVAPFPVFWEYNCGNCWAFERPTLTCKWVVEKGWPNPEVIHSQGWCVVWMPRAGDPPFGYLGKIPWLFREPPPAFP